MYTNLCVMMRIILGKCMILQNALKTGHYEGAGFAILQCPDRGLCVSPVNASQQLLVMQINMVC